MIKELKSVVVVSTSYSSEGHEWPSEERTLNEIIDELNNHYQQHYGSNASNFVNRDLRMLLFNEETITIWDGEDNTKTKYEVKQ